MKIGDLVRYRQSVRGFSGNPVGVVLEISSQKYSPSGVFPSVLCSWAGGHGRESHLGWARIKWVEVINERS